MKAVRDDGLAPARHHVVTVRPCGEREACTGRRGARVDSRGIAGPGVPQQDPPAEIASCSRGAWGLRVEQLAGAEMATVWPQPPLAP